MIVNSRKKKKIVLPTKTLLANQNRAWLRLPSCHTKCSRNAISPQCHWVCDPSDAYYYHRVVKCDVICVKMTSGSKRTNGAVKMFPTVFFKAVSVIINLNCCRQRINCRKTLWLYFSGLFLCLDREMRHNLQALLCARCFCIFGSVIVALHFWISFPCLPVVSCFLVYTDEIFRYI
jgi:hypothetical protein